MSLLDSDTAAFLSSLADAPSLTAGDIETVRANAAEFLRIVGIEEISVESVSEIAIPGPAGPIPARYIRGTKSAAALLVYLHGGGWVLGDLDSHDGLCRQLATHCGVDVLNVAYRLAPEHPFPAGLDDSFAAAAWAAADLADGRPLVIAGDSAGGNLAAAVALRACGEGFPEVALQVLFYPVLDHALDTPSYARFGQGHLLQRDDMRWFLDLYAPSPLERDQPSVSPLRAAGLSGVAPALIVVGGCDPLLDEATSYATRLREAGVPTELSVFPGHIHGFLTIPGAIPSAKVALVDVLEKVRKRVADAAARSQGS